MEPPPLNAETVAIFDRLCRELKKSSNQKEQLRALRKIRSVLTSPSLTSEIPINEFFEAGLIEPIFLLCEPNIPESYIQSIPESSNFSREIIKEAVGILSNICAGSGRTFEYLLNRGILNLIQKILLFDEPGSFENAVYCLGNLLGEEPNIKFKIEELQLFKIISEGTERFSKKGKLLEVAAWTISNALRDSSNPQPSNPSASNASETPPSPFDIEIIKILGRILSLSAQNHNLNASCECAWGLVYFLNKNVSITSRISFVSSLDPEVPLTQCIMSSDDLILKPALRVLSYLAYGSHFIVEKLSNSGVFPHVTWLALSGKTKAIQKEALWFLGNLISTGEPYSKTFFTKEIVEGLISIVMEEWVVVASEASVTLGSFARHADMSQLRVFVDAYNLPHLVLMKAREVGKFDSWDDKKLKYSEVGFLANLLKLLWYLLDKGRELETSIVKNALLENSGLQILNDLERFGDDELLNVGRKIAIEYFEHEGLN